MLDIESGSPCALAYVDIDMYKVAALVKVDTEG